MSVLDLSLWLCTIHVYIKLKGIPFWNCSNSKTKILITENITPLERSESIDLKYARYARFVCTAYQTPMSEKHVYINAFFRHCDAMMQCVHALPQALAL
jgi:hypothetical protein